MTPIPTNMEIIVANVQAENAQLREIEAANKETIRYWRAQYDKKCTEIEALKNKLAFALNEWSQNDDELAADKFAAECFDTWEEIRSRALKESE